MSMCDDNCCGRGSEEREQIEEIKKILGIEKIIERERDAEKFANECLEHLKKIEVPDSHIKELCRLLGNVPVTDCLGACIDDVAVFPKLEEEVRKIVQGNRADVIYAFQDFATNFLSEKESGEQS